jgi:hypothetical protein
MNSVILISSEPFDLARLLKACGGAGSAYLQSPKRLIVEGDRGWFAIGIDEGLEEEFSGMELSTLEQIIPEPYFAQLEYSSPSVADLAVRLMPVSGTMLIDNDHGLTRSIDEVRQRIQAGVEWQTSPD